MISSRSSYNFSALFWVCLQGTWVVHFVSTPLAVEGPSSLFELPCIPTSFSLYRYKYTMILNIYRYNHDVKRDCLCLRFDNFIYTALQKPCCIKAIAYRCFVTYEYFWCGMLFIVILLWLPVFHKCFLMDTVKKLHSYIKIRDWGAHPSTAVYELEKLGHINQPPPSPIVLIASMFFESHWYPLLSTIQLHCATALEQKDEFFPKKHRLRMLHMSKKCSKCSDICVLGLICDVKSSIHNFEANFVKPNRKEAWFESKLNYVFVLAELGLVQVWLVV